MAVAVSSSSEPTPKASPNSGNLAVTCLIGAAFVLLAAWAILRGIPWLWDHGVGSAITDATNSFVSTAVQVAVLAAATILVFFIGARLLGAHGLVGVRGGIFFMVLAALVSFFAVLGLIRVAGRPFSLGGLIVMLFWVAILVLVVQFFRTGRFRQWSIAVDEGGWFSVRTHKRSQGLRVRRLTMLGVLLISGTGIYTLINHNYLPANAIVKVPYREEGGPGGGEIKFREQSNRMGDWIVGGTVLEPQRVPSGPNVTEGEREFIRMENRARPRVEGGIVLLPDLQFTVPLILIGATLWLAWRLVNYPAFADFLIATEAEMNKVSWSSRRALVRDTLVVLTTLLLLTLFLFLVDVFWGWLLSQSWIGVLPGEGDIPAPTRAEPVKDW